LAFDFYGQKSAQGEKEVGIFKIYDFLRKIIDGKSILCQYNIHGYINMSFCNCLKLNYKKIAK